MSEALTQPFEDELKLMLELKTAALLDQKVDDQSQDREDKNKKCDGHWNGDRSNDLFRYRGQNLIKGAFVAITVSVITLPVRIFSKRNHYTRLLARSTLKYFVRGK
jgi:hypothetical protein